LILLAYVHLRNIHQSTGAGRVARSLIENLVLEPDIQMHILADAGDHGKVVPKVGLPWTKFEYHLFQSDTSMQQARWALTGEPVAERYCPKADLVYCTGESYVPTRKQPLVVTLHDAAIFEHGAHKPSYSLLKQRLKWRLLYTILARRADLFHTVSHFSAERLGHYFPAIRSRLRVVYNAAPERFFAPVSPEGEQFLEQTGLKNTPYILLPGGLHYRKNAETALAAWSMPNRALQDYRLVVVGHSEAEYLSRARAFGRRVLLTGFVNDEVLCSLYHGAKAVWIPSHYEGFGVPVLEAMASGAAVVASDSSAIPEVAGNAAVLVPPKAVGSHLEALATVCENNQLREKLIALGHARAEQFRWRVSARRLLSSFRSIV
jgi:glycosyltransferase involved in cell wall biosynthesis